MMEPQTIMSATRMPGAKSELTGGIGRAWRGGCGARAGRTLQSCGPLVVRVQVWGRCYVKSSVDWAIPVALCTRLAPQSDVEGRACGVQAGAAGLVCGGAGPVWPSRYHARAARPPPPDKTRRGGGQGPPPGPALYFQAWRVRRSLASPRRNRAPQRRGRAAAVEATDRPCFRHSSPARCCCAPPRDAARTRRKSA